MVVLPLLSRDWPLLTGAGGERCTTVTETGDSDGDGKTFVIGAGDER